MGLQLLTILIVDWSPISQLINDYIFLKLEHEFALIMWQMQENVITYQILDVLVRVAAV